MPFVNFSRPRQMFLSLTDILRLELPVVYRQDTLSPVSMVSYQRLPADDNMYEFPNLLSKRKLSEESQM